METMQILIAGVATLILGGANVANLREIYSWHDSKHWPMTPGKIIKAQEKICFEYFVNGTRYESDNVKIGGAVWNSSQAKAEEYLTKYPVNTQVNVLYNPNKPSTSALERGENYKSNIFRLMIGMLVLAFPLWFVLASFSKL